MENVSHISIHPNLYFYTDTQVLNQEKFLCRVMIFTEDVRFDQAYHDWINKCAVPQGDPMVQPRSRSVFPSSSRFAPFCIAAGEALEKRLPRLCAQNNYVEISLFKMKPAPVLL